MKTTVESITKTQTNNPLSYNQIVKKAGVYIPVGDADVRIVVLDDLSMLYIDLTDNIVQIAFPSVWNEDKFKKDSEALSLSFKN